MAKKVTDSGKKRTTRSVYRLEAKNGDGSTVQIGEMYRKSDIDEFIRIATEYGLGSFDKVRFVKVITSNTDW